MKRQRPTTASAIAAARLTIGSSPAKRFSSSLRRGNDRQQEVRVSAGAEMQRGPGVEGRCRAVVAIDMKKWPHPPHWIGCIRQRRIAPIHLIVPTTYCKRKPMPRRQYDRRRPDFDVDFDLFAG